MKLLIAIIQERDRKAVTASLSSSGMFYTKIASTGGFLRDGNVTLLLGIEDERLDEALAIIRDNSQAREQYVSVPPPEVLPTPSCWVIRKPLPVVSMHWVAEVPQRLFWTM